WHVGFFFSSRRRHTRSKRDWSSDVCSSDLPQVVRVRGEAVVRRDRVEDARAGGVGIDLDAVAEVAEGDVADVEVAAGVELVEAEIGRASCRERWKSSGAAMAGRRRQTVILH